MQETHTLIKTKTKLTNKEVLITLLNVLIREGYSFNSSEEIVTAINKKFNVKVSVELVEELWCEGRELEDVYLYYKYNSNGN